MDNKNYLKNIEEPWKRMKEYILSNVSEENAIEVDFLVNSIENRLSAIKVKLTNSTDNKPKQKSSVTTEDNVENNKEIDIERIRYRIKKCLLWLDAVSDDMPLLVYLYKFKEEDIENEVMFLNFLKSQDIDFDGGKFMLMGDYYGSYIQFNDPVVSVIKEKLNAFC